MRSLRIIFVLLVLVYTLGRASAEEARRKVLLVGDSTPTSDTLSFPGLSVLPSRPQGAMVEIPESSWESFLQSHADAVLLAEEDLLYLPGMTVDTQVSSAKRAKMETGGNRLRIIQFHNPPTEADEDDLAQRGLKVLQSIPTNALLVLAPTGKENDLPTTGSLVRFVGHLPEEVVKAAVADLSTSSTLDAEGRAPLFVCAADDPTVNQSIASWLAANPTVDSAGEANEGGVLRYRLRMTPEQIDSIASVDGAVSITTAAAGIVYLDEMQSLIVDNQLTTVGSGNHAPQRPYAPAVTPAPPDGKFDSHLDFLDGKLHDVGTPAEDGTPAWKLPGAYPILTIVDVGLGDGNPLMPQREDFYLEGLKDPELPQATTPEAGTCLSSDRSGCETR
jgi:hypothetical protein